MRNTGLKLRMLIAGGIVFGFYALFATYAYRAGVGLPVVLAASGLFALAQYGLGKYLAVRSVGAEDLPEEEYPEIHRSVERMSEEMGIPKPTLKVGRMGVPNAFAVGRQGAGVVVVSDTLIQLLDPDELEAVLAHELAHIKHRDVIVMLLGQSVASMIGITVFWLTSLAGESFVGTILGWVLSTIVQMIVMVFVLAISRYREYVADETAAEYADGDALARALAKIGEVGHHEDAPDVSDSVGALCIFGGKRGLLATLFATHPPMEKRIDRLQSV
jgi:heat shock protein HtpX